MTTLWESLKEVGNFFVDNWQIIAGIVGVLGALVSMLTFFGVTYKTIQTWYKERFHRKKWLTDFLNYNVVDLKEHYNQEALVGDTAYVELKSWVTEPCQSQILGERSSKECTPVNYGDKDSEWYKTSDAAFKAFKKSGKVKHNGNKIGMSNFEKDNEKTVLTVHLTQYHDQARTNLVLDYELNNNTLRKILRGKYEGKLPPLTDRRLANTIGAATIVFCNDGDSLKVFLPERNEKNVAVFEGGFHCSASVAVDWDENFVKNDKININEMCEKSMRNKLKSEIGLDKDDLVFLRPIALCRELLRGGKPQLFYVAYTRLSKDTLTQKVPEAKRKESERNNEGKSKSLEKNTKNYRFVNEYESQSADQTLECDAALHYAWQATKQEWFQQAIRA